MRGFSATTLTFAAVGCFAASIVLGPLFGEYGSFHYAQLALAVGFVFGWLRNPQLLSEPLSRRAWVALLVTSLIWLEAVALSTFASFNIGGVDFSIFDWMLESGARGNFGYSSIYTVNHLGVHSTFLLALLVPFHALAPSPLWLVIGGPVVLWAGLFPLRRLVQRAVGDHGGVLLAASLAYVAGPHLGRLTSETFRIESLIPLGTLWFLTGWVEQRRGLWIAAVTFLFFTKEDATLYLGSFATACVLFERPRRLEAVVLLIACVAWLGVYTQLIQPALTGRGLGYLTFWSDFGTTPRTLLWNMATHPGAVLKRILTSGVWAYFAPLLFLPWLSWRALAGIAPTVFLLGSATYETMHSYLTYYPTPLLAFALFGVLEVMRERKTRAWMAAALLALCLFPLVGFGYARVNSVDLSRLRDVALVRERIASLPRVCGQTVLFPHLGYPAQLVPLFEVSCADAPGTWIVASKGFDPYPLSRAELDQAIDHWRETRPVTEMGPFLLFGP